MFAEGTQILTESKNSYIIAKRIGNGAFGTVFRVKMKHDKQLSKSVSESKSKE
jgi:hypothetical protein